MSQTIETQESPATATQDPPVSPPPGSPRSSAAASPVEPTRVLGFTLGQLCVVLFWPFALLAAWVFFLSPTKDLQGGLGEALDDRPPLVVYNVTDRLRTHGQAGLQGDDALRKLDEEVQMLVDSGYIVIDARTILGSPSRYNVGEAQ